MRHEGVARAVERVSQALERAQDVDEDADELRADLARYVCVMVSGLFESAVKALFRGYVAANADDRVQSHFESVLKVINSVDAGRLTGIAGQFDPRWKGSLTDFIEGERRDAIESVVAQRHAIAHGDTSDITLSAVRDYFVSIVEVIDFLERLLFPSPAAAAA